MNIADVTSAGTTPSRDVATGGKYLTFVLGDEEYGIEITRVREIIGIVDITPVPKAPLFIKGIINIRGKVIPIVDMRAKFGMDQIDFTSQTCIIVVEVDDNLMGILVDTVSEVLDIQEENIDPPPSFGSESSAMFILGMAKIKGAVKILLNIDKVLDAKEMVSIEELTRPS
ncbi:Positive regulator of CheA protein activity (CheW) [hydrothermal vent metagenome]|uniref:Positive regulator of CheA protein activity (CheW) n=1 Tax=hydrothermal vent metagenome TaxID=652676 RepID=A0A3B1D351_9ZZZZ